jgi:glycosyltransferase involved in cell wall biosynthesis
MDGPPRVTVAMPTYGRAASLERALTAVRRQTFEDLEIIVCDNASPAETTAVVDAASREDPRVRLHRHPSNVGAVKNFETGLLLAQGELFMWAADDDWMEPNLIQHLVGLHDTRPATALACAEAQYVDLEEEPLPFFVEGDALRSRPAAGPDLVERLRALQAGHFGNLIYGLYRRSALLPQVDGQPVGSAFSIYDEVAVARHGFNELPLLLLVVAAGDIIVSPERLWWKSAPAPIYTEAAIEAERRGNPVAVAAPRPQRAMPGRAAALARVRADVRYHATTAADIVSALRALPLAPVDRLRLSVEFSAAVGRHFFVFEARQARRMLGQLTDG